MRSLTLFVLFSIFLFSPRLWAGENVPTPAFTPSVVQEFIADMQTRHGFDAALLTRQFAAIHSNPAVLRAIQPSAVPELQRNWHDYRARFLDEAHLTQGRNFWRKHAASLKRAEAIYGVPQEIILAIIGIETGYGRNTGKFGVFEALATLAFEYPPRAPFFRKELEQFLLMAREDGLSPLDYKGSYAGAIGIPQFMPSSRRRFAVDFDLDGRIDLRHSPADAIGSVARFLNDHGWRPGALIALPVRVNGDVTALLAAGIEPSTPLREMYAQGVMFPIDRFNADLSAALIEFPTPGQPAEYWIGFDNFHVITRYNRSSFYALSVFLLAESLRKTETDIKP